MINPNVLKNASNLKNVFYTSSPFPHIVIDNFLSPEILDVSLEEIKLFQDWSCDAQLPKYQVNKYFVPATDSDELTKESLNSLQKFAPTTLSILHYLYSEEAFEFISELTTIQNLQKDNSWFGAGAHKVMNGGKLEIHADFNLNWKINKYRRVNLLLYLNKEWKEEYNGYLELWEKDMSKCSAKISPIFNRAVIFATDKTSYHGHPTPLNLPENIARYSLALYYYSDVPPKNDEENRFVSWQSTN